MSVLDNPTLVLNKNRQAIRVEPLEKCFCKVFAGRAKFLDHETSVAYDWDNWFNMFSFPIDESTEGLGYDWIKSANRKIRVPEITMVTHYGRMPITEVKLTRRNILIRDHYKCQYSGKKVTMRDMTIDHVLPQSRGGKTTWTNVVVASQSANVKKANRTPEEAGMKLIKLPTKPKWHPLYTYCLDKIRKSWEPYIKTDQWNEFGYWDVELID
jgi:5-methylcytosine-specific restriction endonuclease McrA